ncbi:MAG TPA: GNAT family N-acetyltransferase [Rudaea sp.]|jgi:GNAT superfamily N-acetyltransferase
MKQHPLDNPVWSSLTTRHAALARRTVHAARYPAEVAPFAAVDAFDADAAGQMATLMQAGETVLFVGPSPPFAAGWRIEPLEHIAQMTCGSRLAVPDGPEVIALGATHTADVLELTSRVYPHYFRSRTVDMGRYFGIYDGTKLAAITGERMRLDGHVELSAICTDPGYTGRGYAQRLVALLANDILDRGDVPFLHVSHRNARAKALYEYLGFRRRVDIALLSAQREA